MDIQDMEDDETRLHGSVVAHVGEQGFTSVLPSVVSLEIVLGRSSCQPASAQAESPLY